MERKREKERKRRKETGREKEEHRRWVRRVKERHDARVQKGIIKKSRIDEY